MRRIHDSVRPRHRESTVVTVDHFWGIRVDAYAHLRVGLVIAVLTRMHRPLEVAGALYRGERSGKESHKSVSGIHGIASVALVDQLPGHPVHLLDRFVPRVAMSLGF